MSAETGRMKKIRLGLTIPAGYNFPGMCRSYLWIKHPPFRFNSSKGTLSYIHDLGTTVCRSVTGVSGRRLEVEVESDKLLDAEEKNLLTLQLRRMYSLQWDLKSFHKLVSKEKEFSWIAKEKLGWFVRSASFFEDAAKMLLSVNCTFEQGQEMITSLVTELGKPVSPKLNVRSFPTPEMIVKIGVGVLRNRIRSGYRSQALAEAAHRFMKGEFNEAELLRLSSFEVRKRLLTLRGLSPSYLRQLMIFLGRFDYLATDGIALSYPSKLVKSLTPLPQAIQAMYRKWGEWQGLVAWFDLHEGKRYSNAL